MLVNHHEIPILKPCLALISGIILSQVMPSSIRVSAILIYVILFFFITQIVSKKKIDHQLRNIVVLVIISCLGVCLMQERSPEFKSYPYDVNSEAFTIRVEKILAHKKHKKVFGHILSYISEDSSFIQSKGKVLLYFEDATDDTSVTVGKEYYATGKLSELSQIPNPHSFDYGSYLQKEEIHHQLFVKKNSWHFLRTNRKSIIHEMVNQLQIHFNKIIERNFSKSTNRGLVMAMVLGDRSELSQNQKDLFINTGAIHVLAVSGLHVGILAMFISFIFKVIDKLISIPKLIQGLFTILILWLFAMITGASSAVCRAALMFSMFYFSRDVLRRHVSIYNIIFSSAFLLLLFDPMQVFKVSFQFSYLAVLSIVFFYPYVNNWVHSRFKPFNYFWSSIAIGISAQILVFPISIFYFNKFASSFLVTSIFVVQLAMVILIATLIILLFDSVGLSILSDHIVSPVCKLVLNIFQQAISKVQDLPYSYIDNIWIDEVQLCGIYLALLFVMIFIKLRKLKFLLVILSCIVFIFFHSNYKAHTHSIQHKAYVYNSRDDLMDVFVGNHCYSIHSDTEEGEIFVYGRNRLANDIKEIEQINNNFSSNAIEFKDGVIRLGNIFLASANGSMFTEMKASTSYDYLLVTKEHNNIKKLDPKQLLDTEIILSGSLAPWIRTEQINYCKSIGLRYYDVKASGAKIIDF